jgi:DNA-binding XRE family transcriptional regulator
MKEHPLRSYRSEKKLTQGMLAEILGVSDATITHIENGRRRITPENAKDWEKKIPISKEILCPEIFGEDQKAA